MNKDQHVYCAECVEFRICDEGLPYCPYEDKCDIKNPEDSRPLRERPCYIKGEW